MNDNEKAGGIVPRNTLLFLGYLRTRLSVSVESRIGPIFSPVAVLQNAVCKHLVDIFLPLLTTTTLYFIRTQ